MFKYTDNLQMKQEIKKILVDKRITAKYVSDKLGIKPQQYNNIFKKRNLSLSDIEKILDVIGCEFYIEIRDKNWFWRF